MKTINSSIALLIFIILFLAQNDCNAHINGGQQNEDCFGNCCVKYPNGGVEYWCRKWDIYCGITCVCCCSWQSEFGMEYMERIIGRELEKKIECKRSAWSVSRECNENEIIWTIQRCEQDMSWRCTTYYSVFYHCPSYEYPLFNCYITISTSVQ